MTLQHEILDLLHKKGEMRCDDCITTHTSATRRQAVFQEAGKLAGTGRIHRGPGICGHCNKQKKVSWVSDSTKPVVPEPTVRAVMAESAGTLKMTGHQFEAIAGPIMETRYGKTLRQGQVPGVHKRFDFVSEDFSVIGDAKYFTMVRGTSIPPAKFSVIAEHVWLLQNIDAPYRFLVFGNDLRVPEEWLRRYGSLTDGVTFYFIDDSNELEVLEGSG